MSPQYSFRLRCDDVVGVSLIATHGEVPIDSPHSHRSSGYTPSGTPRAKGVGASASTNRQSSMTALNESALNAPAGFYIFRISEEVLAGASGLGMQSSHGMQRPLEERDLLDVVDTYQVQHFFLRSLSFRP